MNIKDELLAIKNEFERERSEDVIHRTLEKLITIEKEAMYGSKTSGKATRIERVLRDEFFAYKEKINASEKN